MAVLAVLVVVVGRRERVRLAALLAALLVLVAVLAVGRVGPRRGAVRWTPPEATAAAVTLRVAGVVAVAAAVVVAERVHHVHRPMRHHITDQSPRCILRLVVVAHAIDRRRQLADKVAASRCTLPHLLLLRRHVHQDHQSRRHRRGLVGGVVVVAVAAGFATAQRSSPTHGH